MTGARVLLTGARGFVGAKVLSHLPVGADLHAVSRAASGTKGAAVRWHQADLLDTRACAALIRDIRPDTLVHCAWETEHGAFWEAESNDAWAEAGRALFMAFREAGGTRIVATGTCAEYVPKEAPLKESDDTGTPATRYGRAKLSLVRYLETQPVSWAWVRIFNTYGSGEDPRRFVPSVARALAKGRVAKCSLGRQIRDFIDVRDLGRAVAALVPARYEGPLNIGSGRSGPLGDVAMALGRIARRQELVGLGQLPDRPGEASVLIPDTTRQMALGLAPEIPLETGLVDAWRFWSHKADFERQEAGQT